MLAERQSVALIGCGWLGRQLLAELQPHYRLLPTTAGSALPIPGYPYRWEHDALPYPVARADAMIILLPPGAGGREHYAKHMQRLIAQLPASAYLMMISSTGVYPAAPGIYDEDSAVDRTHPLSIAEAFVRAHPRATILRSGGQYGAGRWPMPQSEVAADKPLNFISGENLCRAIHVLLQNPRPGKTYNLVEPDHPLFSTFLCRHAQYIAPPHPRFLPPQAAPRLIDGRRITQDTPFAYRLFSDGQTSASGTELSR